MKHAWELPISLEQVLQCLPLALNFYYMRSIVTGESTLTTGDFYLKKLHSSRVVKRCTRFWRQVRILILHLSFMNHFLTLCFNQLKYLHFLCHQVLLWRLSSSFSYAIFSYLYLSNYLRSSLVSNWRRGMICCQLTPTLYHCATKDYGHILLFVFHI